MLDPRDGSFGEVELTGDVVLGAALPAQDFDLLAGLK